MTRPEQSGAGGSIDPPEWRLTLLAVAMGAYVLGMGQTLALNGQHGHYWFFLAPWWTATTFRYLASAAVMAAVAYRWGARLRPWIPAGLAVLLLASQGLFARAAWGVVGQGIPWGFDHPSFMYRIHEFGQLFPLAIGGYNPWWNAGTEHFVGVTSGSHGFGLLLLPLLKIWEPHQFYGAALVFWFVFGFPWLGVAAVRSAGVGRAGALCAGLLMCGASRGVFMWMWHFGTVGAMTSAMMVLPVVALGYRLAVLRRGGWGTALALAWSAWLMCLWTPGVFIGAGLALGWLWNAREWTWRSNGWLLAAGALALALLSPWLWTTWFPCSHVLEHVGTPMARPGVAQILSNGGGRLGVGLQEWHPVVLWLGGLGTLLAAPRPLRRWIVPGLVLLGAIAGWSRELKPLSQLERMAIPMAVLAVFPAAVLCDRLLGGDPPSGRPSAGIGRRRAWLRALAQGLLLATLLSGVRVVRTHYSNRGQAPLRVFSAGMQDFVDWIRAEVPEEGRLGFVGRNVHFFGGGNIAYLPILTGREMMGDDYYGFPRGTIEYDYPPAAYRRNPRAFSFFGRAYGITHWVAAQPQAQAQLDAYPDRFERVREMPMSGRMFSIYRVRNPGRLSRFWEGDGRVEARENHLDVHVADPAADRVVIRYNWRAGLRCLTPGASIEPFAVDKHLRFIAIRPGGNACVSIGYRPHAAPIQPNFDGTFHH